MATMKAALPPDGNPELVHRSITEGQLDVHPTLSAIVVHYQMEAVVISEYGEPMVANQKECRKLLKIQNLSRGTDIQALAWHIISKCELIQPNRLPEMQQLLSYLQTRNSTQSGKDVLETSSRQIEEQIDDLRDPAEKASILELESYLEVLYDDLQAKIRGSGLILQLARSPDNLMELVENESLFLALARVLKEDWKKSIDLSTNIIYIFFCLSTFSVFHKLLARHKIGSTSMIVIEHEIKRYKSLQDDLEEKKNNCKSGAGSAANKAKKEYEKTKKKFQLLLTKQETLLRVALYLLLNLSEDTHVEIKMRNKGLVSQLSSLLDRSNQELLILVVSFLKKLSIYAENKDEMAKTNIITKLSKLVPCDNEILMNVILRLLLNLSFDVKLRQEMVKAGLLPKLTPLLRDKNHRVVVLCILYHISMDWKARSLFSYTDCIPELMKLILECPDELVEPETVALGINLACSSRNVQIICNGSGLKLLMKRALKTKDSLLFKMIRNISSCPGTTKNLILAFLTELCQVLKESEGDEELCVEILGILGNLTIPEVDFYKVVTELGLLPFIITKLKDATTMDDLLLEVVVLCGTFSIDERFANLLVQAKVPNLLINILKAKQEDDEIVLQIVYLFYHLILHKSTREIVTKQTLAPDYLLELMNDKNKEICKLCSKTLDIIQECDPEMALRVKSERFRWHNYQWLEMMMGKTLNNEEAIDEDYLDPNFLHTAAELYDIPDMGHPGKVELEYGRNFDPFDEEHKSYRMIPHSQQPDYMRSPSPNMFSDLDEPEGSRSEVLSPQQYALLMNSMRDPLAMYTNSMTSGGMSQPPSQMDSMEMYTDHGYNISPTYAQFGAGSRPNAGESSGNRGLRRAEEESHPAAFALNYQGYQPRPPPPRAPNPRPPQSRY